MLISSYAELEHKFADPRLKKNQVWAEIEKRMKEKLYHFTATDRVANPPGTGGSLPESPPTSRLPAVC